jgi:hypothetical protein
LKPPRLLPTHPASLLAITLTLLAACGTSPVSARAGSDDDTSADSDDDTSADSDDADADTRSDSNDGDDGDDDTADTSDTRFEDPAIDTSPLLLEDPCINGRQDPGEAGIDCDGACDACSPKLFDCEGECADRRVDGGCIDSSPQTCEAYCASYPDRFTDEMESALEDCMEESPLCFETLAQCAVSRVYFQPYEHRVVLEGSGFERYEGAGVRAVVSADTPGLRQLGETTVQGGAFRVEWTMTATPFADHNVLFQIDLDDDGRCDATTDYLDLASPEQQPLLLGVPSFVYRVGLRREPGEFAFVCEYL